MAEGEGVSDSKTSALGSWVDGVPLAKRVNARYKVSVLEEDEFPIDPVLLRCLWNN